MIEPNENITTNRDNFLKNLTDVTEGIFRSKDSCPAYVFFIIYSNIVRDVSGTNFKEGWGEGGHCNISQSNFP